MHTGIIVGFGYTGALAAIMMAAPAAAYVNVFGGPTYTTGVGGFKDGFATGVNDAGVAIGTASKYDASDTYFGNGAFRWDSSGAAATELGNLGTDPNGFTLVSPGAINNAGTVAGSALSYDGFGEFLGERAIRWDASSTVAIALGNLGTDLDGVTFGGTSAINDAGTIVGRYEKFDASGDSLHNRGVRWESSSTTPIELEILTTGTNGPVGSIARAINAAGTTVGDSAKFAGSGQSLGVRAVRWDASGTAVTELGNLGTDPDGYAIVTAYAINSAGTIIGDGGVYDGSGTYFGDTAIRWDDSGTTATPLGNLGTDVDGISYTGVYAINDVGTVVGYADRYDGSGEYLDNIAVRWDASGTAATALGFLGTDLDGLTDSTAFDINNAGITVGYASDYDGSGTYLGDRAVYWGLDGVAVDLNTLIDPNSGWTLEYANFISDTGWIAGSGTFDPDGPGGQEQYGRLFLLQLPFSRGDFNFDGDVDGLDFLAWQRNPGIGNLSDWEANYGLPATSIATAVPEPGAVVLALVGFAVTARERRRERAEVETTDFST